MKPLPDQAAVYRSEGLKRWAVDRLATERITGFFVGLRPAGQYGVRWSGRREHLVSDLFSLLHGEKVIPPLRVSQYPVRWPKIVCFFVRKRRLAGAVACAVRGEARNTLLKRVLLQYIFFRRKNVINAIP